VEIPDRIPITEHASFRIPTVSLLQIPFRQLADSLFLPLSAYTLEQMRLAQLEISLLGFKGEIHLIKQNS